MKRSRSNLTLTAALALGAFHVPCANAANEYWSGAGDWANSTWGTTSGGPYNTTWTSGNVAFFEGTGASVTLSGPQTAGTLNFTTGGYNLSGSTITVSGTNVNVSSGFTDTIASDITATNHLFIAGDGTLNLTGAGSVSGHFAISGGTIVSYAGGANTFTANSGGFNSYIGNAGGSLLSRLQVTSGTFTSPGTTINIGVGSSGALDISGTGNVSATNVRSLLQNSGTTATANLDGGTLTTNAIFNSGNGGTTFTVNLNGGTLKAGAAGTLMNSNITRVNVRNGGALIDTNSNNATIAAALQHSNIGGDAATDGGLTKSGSGTLTLAGANSYTGTTTVSGGTLAFSGAGSITGSSTIDVQSGGTLQGGTIATGQTLKGNGTLTGAVTMASGSTLSPAGAGVIGSMTMDGSLSLAGNTVIDINKSGATLTSDAIAGAGSVTYGGTLTVNATGDALALGNTFTLFPCTGGYSGSFTAYVLPALPAGLSWDKSNLTPTGNGTITVVNYVGTPIFTPAAGNYVGAQSVSIASDAGSTIYYTLDGSTPNASSPHIASPVTGITVPTNSSMTIKAYAIKAGQADSPVSTASYTTITTPTWNVDSDGNWSDAANWLSNVIPDGISAPADFSVINQSGPATVTLDSNRTVGSLKFGNANEFDWLIASSGGSVLTLAKTAGTPAITVLNNAATISAVLAGSQGLTKDGSGTLTLSANNTYTGTTTVNSGSVIFGGTSFATSSLSVSSGATAEFTANGGGVIVPSALTGAGTFKQSGTTSLRPIGNNNAFAGTYELTAGDMVFGTAATADIPNQWSPGAAYALNGGSLRLYQLGSAVVEIGALSGTSSSSVVGCWNSGTPTVKVGALGTDTTFAGAIVNQAIGGGAGGVSLHKVGTGTLTLAGANSYTGNTTVSAGTLHLADGGQLAFALGATSGVSNSISGAGTLVVDGDFVINTAAAAALTTGTWTLENVPSLTGPYGSTFTVVGFTDAGNNKWTKTDGTKLWTFDETTGVLTLGAGGYSSWADANAGGQGPELDFDNDGVKNGIEYFMGQTGSGFTALPGPVTAGGVTTVTWTRDPAATVSSFAVEFSSTLNGDWAPVPAGEVNLSDPTKVVYTFPAPLSGKRFVRLSVTP